MHIRFISILLSMVLLLLLSPHAIAEEGMYVLTAEVTATVCNPDPTDRLNLRTKPSTDAPTLGKYYNGTFIEVLNDENNGFVKVRFCNLEGYMQKSLLAFDADRGQVASAIPSVIIKNDGGTGLNLRLTQSIHSKSLGFYANGEMVFVYGVGETWCHVQAPDGKIGFMLREKLSPILDFDKGSGSSTGSSGSQPGTVIRTAMVNNPNPEDRLNLRAAPNTEAATLCKYYNGVQVELLGDENNGWIKVRIGNLDGYMRTAFLETDYSKTIGSALPSYSIDNAAGTGLTLRASQSTSANSLGFYTNGEMGYVYGVSETWCHVIAPDGKIGFMLREMLSPILEFDKGSGSSGSGTPPSVNGDLLEGTTNYDENGVPIGGNG